MLVAIFVVVCASLGSIIALRSDTQRYRMPSESMVPTFQVGDRLTLNHDAYQDAAPVLGDIVIVHPPRGAEDGACGEEAAQGQMCARPTPERTDVLFAKRVVAGPGDRVSMEDGIIVRNGDRLAEPYARACGGEGCDFPIESRIPDGHYLVLGDNRGASDDSRFWGPVQRSWIVGRVDDCNIVGMGCSPRR